MFWTWNILLYMWNYVKNSMQRAPETADNVLPTALTAENIQEWKMAHLFSLQGSADEVSCDALHTHTQKSHMRFMGDFCFMKTVGVHSTHTFNVFPSHTRVAESEIWNINWSSLWCHLRELVDQRRTDMTTVKYIIYSVYIFLKRPNFWSTADIEFHDACFYIWQTKKDIIIIIIIIIINNNYNYLTYYIILLYTCMFIHVCIV